MNYSERAYFTTDACAHCAARDEHLRLERIERQRIRAVAHKQWRALPDYTRAKEAARLHLVAMPGDKLAALNAEWEA